MAPGRDATPVDSAMESERLATLAFEITTPSEGMVIGLQPTGTLIHTRMALGDTRLGTFDGTPRCRDLSPPHLGCDQPCRPSMLLHTEWVVVCTSSLRKERLCVCSGWCTSGELPTSCVSGSDAVPSTKGIGHTIAPRPLRVRHRPWCGGCVSSAPGRLCNRHDV